MINLDASQDITELLLAVKMFKLISIFSYRFVLWVDGSIQMWPHCTFKIVYCSGLRTWIFGWTLWTVAEQTFTIRTPTRAWEWYRVQATHETPPALPSSSWAWIGRMWVAKYRSNNMALWHGAEAHVVSYCVCWRVRSHGGTLLLTGHLLGPFRRHPMTVLVIIIAILHCLLNVQRVGLHPVAMNLVWAVEQCTREMCVRARYRPISGSRDNRKVADSAINIAVSPYRYESYRCFNRTKFTIQMHVMSLGACLIPTCIIPTHGIPTGSWLLSALHMLFGICMTRLLTTDDW